MNSKKITFLSALTAVSLIMFLLENLLIPVIPFAPYVKLGLSNCIIIFVLYYFGEKESFIVMLAKVLLGSLISGNWYAFAFNISGGFCSLLAMAALRRFFKDKVSLICVSISGATVSNIVRTGVGALIMQTVGLFYTLPAAILISVPAGIAAGALSVLLIKALPKKVFNL